MFENIALDMDLDRELFDGRGLASIDYLNSGSPSLVVSNQKAAAKFYRNEQLNRNAWIGFSFVGRKSNIGGWGVRVTIDLGDRKITRELEPLNGYASLGEDRLLIGLGVEPKIREIEVIWPSGIRQK
ncbi:MAG: ASPIC/UnbV domain-containing protein [Bdellovibrionales bacterium]|nr:ASPIC/UnbV domain-containing protein [Bdellovibrionales bacterium]